MSESEFVRLRDLIYTEVENAFIIFHSYEELNRLSLSDPDVFKVLNQDALFWNGYRYALQTNMFMTLSRLFDTTSGVQNLRTLLTATIGNPQLFNYASLGSRKQINGQKPDRWDDYMTNAWFPQESSDLRFLQKAFAPYAKHFEEVYLPIRHAIYAHRLRTNEEAAVDLFPKTDRNKLREIVDFIYNLVHVIDDLYVNGREPVLGKVNVDYAAQHARKSVEDLLRKLVDKKISE